MKKFYYRATGSCYWSNCEAKTKTEVKRSHKYMGSKIEVFTEEEMKAFYEKHPNMKVVW